MSKTTASRILLRFPSRPVIALVRIDLLEGKTTEYREQAGRVVYDAMLEEFGVPKNDPA
jgi:hypothetical protein